MGFPEVWPIELVGRFGDVATILDLSTERLEFFFGGLRWLRSVGMRSDHDDKTLNKNTMMILVDLVFDSIVCSVSNDYTVHSMYILRIVS